jgi:hypothetical protein
MAAEAADRIEVAAGLGERWSVPYTRSRCEKVAARVCWPGARIHVRAVPPGLPARGTGSAHRARHCDLARQDNVVKLRVPAVRLAGWRDDFPEGGTARLLRKSLAARSGEAAGILLALCLIAGTAAAQGGFSCGFEEWELPVPMNPVWVGLTDTLYGFRENRVYQSTDRGETWSQIHFFEGDRTCRALFVDSRGSIFVARAGSGKLQLGKYQDGLGRVWSEPLAFQCPLRGGGPVHGLCVRSHRR